MIYREFLVMRKALVWYSLMLLALGIWTFGWLYANTPPGSHSSTDLGRMAVPIAWSTCVFAGIFGVALGNGSREPARLLWSLPFPRWLLALRIVAVDWIGIVAAFAITYALSLLLFVSMGLRGRVEIRGSIDFWTVATALFFLFAVYGWTALVGILGRRVAYLGIAALPVLFMWWAFATSRGSLGKALRALLAVNPAAVYQTAWHSPMLGSIGDALQSMGPGWKLATLAAIALVGCAASVYLWERAEVLP